MDKEFKPLDESLITSEVCMRCAQCCKSTSTTQYAAPNATDYVDTVCLLYTSPSPRDS